MEEEGKMDDYNNNDNTIEEEEEECKILGLASID
jgi:hypothetical protein